MKNKSTKTDRIYLDYSATTPVDPRVVKEMSNFMLKNFGNPSSIHSFGRDAKKILEESRAICLDFIGADSSQELIFTSGGSEADNMVIESVIRNSKIVKPHIMTTPIEHKAILDKLKDLEKKGLIEVSLLPVDKYGLVSLDNVKREIRHNTVLITIMYANNEIGTIEPIREVGKYLEKLNEQRIKAAYSKIYFHTDAVQAFGYLNCNVKYLHVDYLSMSAHKIYGPKGIGFLYAKKGSPLERLILGGGQEFGKRAGTENTSGIVGLAKAIELLKKDPSTSSGQRHEKEEIRVKKLRDNLIAGILKISGTKLTGHPKERLPGLASFVFEAIEGESILINLDLEGIAVSTGSACTSGTLSPSHVLTACGYSHIEAQGNIRFSLGRFTTEAEIKRVLEVLPPIVERLRAMSPLG